MALALGALAMLAAPHAAQAQTACLDCDPTTSACSEECWYCQTPHINNDCPEYEVQYSTCGEYNGSGCIQDGCTPDFQEISRVVQGTYGTTHYVWPDVYCEHHSMEWVTQEDVNHCNTNSYYWYHSYCHDDQDGYKIATHSVDCCDGEDINGFPDSTYTCNDYHDCTG